MSNFKDRHHLVHLRPKFFHPSDLRRPSSNEAPSPNDNQLIKRKQNHFVALYSCVCSCSKISWNVFYLKLFTFLVLILQSTCFICTTSKRKQSMEQQPHHACVRTKPKQKQNQVTSHSNWSLVLLFVLVHKPCNGVIKRWLHCLTSESRLHCLTSESKGRFLIRTMLMFGSAWCLVMAQIRFF